KANADAQKMIDETRESAAHLSERKQQEAITTAEQIIAKAREAAAIEHDRTMESLKRELGRLVVDTTAKVTGKVLTQDDQQRLQPPRTASTRTLKFKTMSTILEEIESKIEELKTSTTKSNVGIVRETGDGVARVEGLSDVMLNEMIEFPNGVYGLALNLEET